MAYSPTELLTVYLDAPGQAAKRSTARLDASRSRTGRSFSSMTPHSLRQASRFLRSNFPSSQVYP